LSCTESSGIGNGLYGLGWNLELAKIERSTKNGKPNYTDNDTFVLIMNGAANTLVRQTSGEYRVRNEGAFLRLRKQGNYWIVQDKNGTKYYFGGDWAGQQSTWPAGQAQAFSWRLSRVDDLNGNIMRYYYLNDALGHRISHIDYAPNNTVRFVYEVRADIIQTYRSGYNQRTSVRLKTIKSFAGNQLASSVELAYTQSNQSLLTQIITHDPEGKLADQVEQLAYTPQTMHTFTGHWQATPSFLQLIIGASHFSISADGFVQSRSYRKNRYVDMNGDGLAELVYLNDAGGITVGYKTYPNIPWVTPEAGVKAVTQQYCGNRVKRTTWPYVSYQYGCVTPSAYQHLMPFVKRSAKLVSTRTYYPRALVDMNGDGLPDWAVKNANGSWHIYFNNGHAFVQTPQVWSDPSASKKGDYLLDVNGDGLPDLLSSTGGRWQAWVNLGGYFSPTAINPTLLTAPYNLNLGSMAPPPPQFSIFARDGEKTPVLTPTPWRKTPLLTTKSNLQSGLTQRISYQVQSGISGAATLNMWTVARVSTSGSVAAEYRSTRYRYAGGVYNNSTKEFRGFRSVTQTDEQTGISTTTDYLQDIVYQGRPLRIRSMQANGQLLSDVQNTWASQSYDTGKRHFPFLQSAISKSYELNGTLISQTTATSRYDAWGNLIQSTSNTGGYATTINNQYSNNSLCGQSTLQVKAPECWMIGKLTRSTVMKSAPNSAALTRTSSFAYNAKGQLTREAIEPSSSNQLITNYTYDRFGNRTTTRVTGTGIVARNTTVQYDANGLFPASTTNALGHVEYYIWDRRFGVKTSLTGPNRLTTRWTYDGFGRKISEVRADGTRTDITYSMNVQNKAYYWKRWVYTRSSGGSASTAYFDSYGRKRIAAAPTFSGAWAYRYTAYNWRGLVLYKTLPYTNWWLHKRTVYSYDLLGRVITTSYPDGSVSRMAYNGLTTTAINAKWQTKTTVQNPLGQVVSVTDATNGVMRYAYDAFGNLIRTTDAANHSTSMTYDIRGRKTAMIDPDMGRWTYAYDALGNLTRQTDAKGQLTTMHYDLLGRMDWRTEAEGTSRWVYDTRWIGGLTSETSIIHL
jgi:YD repeat-containing protein